MYSKSAGKHKNKKKEILDFAGLSATPLMNQDHSETVPWGLCRQLVAPVCVVVEQYHAAMTLGAVAAL